MYQDEKKMVYTVDEVATMLHISKRNAYYFCNETKEFGVIKINKSIRIHKESFDRWLSGK